jgi:hypothetical protein
MPPKKDTRIFPQPVMAIRMLASILPVCVPFGLVLIWGGLREDRGDLVLAGPVPLLSLLLVPQALSSLGIRMRGRSVGRSHSAGRRLEVPMIDDLPIRIYRGPWLMRVMAVASFLGGLVCLVLASCLVFTWFPPPGPKMDALVLTLFLFEGGFILMGAAFLARRCKPDLLCEISEKGILAPDGFWGRRAFVPWGELSRCEIIHDDENELVDDFVLWDRAGRHRFKPFKNWWGRLRRSDRNRILRALRSRFPQKERSDRAPESALAHQASSTLWDRELDG